MGIPTEEAVGNHGSTDVWTNWPSSRYVSPNWKKCPQTFFGLGRLLHKETAKGLGPINALLTKLCERFLGGWTPAPGLGNRFLDRRPGVNLLDFV